MPQVTTATGSHPLQRSGTGRTLYAAGLAVDLGGLLLLLALFSGVVPAPGPVRDGSFLGVLATQFAGRRLRARAWWHVPLRDARPVPDRVDLVFWSVYAAAIVATAALQVSGAARPGSPVVPLWALVGIGVLVALLPAADRPAPEPPGNWWTRGVPALTAAAAVLGLGVAGGVLAPGPAAVVAVAAAALVAVSRVAARRRTRC